MEARQDLDAVVATGADDLANGLDLRGGPQFPLEATLHGPAPVAIHDDGDVARHMGGVDLQMEVRRAGRIAITRG